MNEGFENSNSELRWWKGEVWVFTLWALEEGYELFGGYALPYWREKGDKDTQSIAEKYYKACQDQLDKKKPLGTKDEDKWETIKKRKPMRGKQKRTQKTQEDTQDATVDESRSSINNELNMLRELFDCNIIDCDGVTTQGGGSGPENHDNHCG